MRIRRGALLVATALVVPLLAGALVGANAGPAAAAGTVTISPSPSPAFAGDAGDPDVVLANGTYYAFTTGTPLGNHIQVLVNTSGVPTSGYGSYTGQDYGSTALPDPPAWEQPTTQTSPGVFSWGGHWLMYYDAAQVGHASDTGYDCLSVATAATLTPTDPQFTDSSSGGLICQPTGSIDPSPFIDPANGNAYLIWKQNDGGSAARATIWSQQLSAEGTSLVGQPSELMYNDTAAYPWESTVEDPDMVYDDDTYYLLFSGGVYTSPGYSQGYAVCSGPAGPCSQPDPNPILTTYGSALGPGGGSLFADGSGSWWIDYAAWQGGSDGCTSYACGATRQLYVAPISLPASPASSSVQVHCAAPAVPTGYWEVASDGGLFAFGDLPFCGSMGGQPLNAPIVGVTATPTGKGYWEVASDGGLFSFGSAPFDGSMGGQPLNKPIVGIAATPTGNGYWEVASDGGIFSFGTAQFYGSMGGKPLNKPIVGMTATPTGNGYWEVASDGGLFAFGSAQFYGSMGGQHLNASIVGMTATPTGKGYWEVASDGGLFAFGTAQFYGSMGGQPLNKPIVGMTATPTGKGYWEVASDGGLFAFGTAQFYGSMGGQPLNKPIVGMAVPT